jgi:hypothetical protein
MRQILSIEQRAARVFTWKAGLSGWSVTGYSVLQQDGCMNTSNIPAAYVKNQFSKRLLDFDRLLYTHPRAKPR